MEITKEFVDKVERLAGEYAKGQFFDLPASSISGFLDHLRSQIEPEYPCPLCGEEMRVEYTFSTVYAECVYADCPLGLTRNYQSEQELKEAL